MKLHVQNREGRNAEKSARQIRRRSSWIRNGAPRLAAGAALLFYLCGPASAATFRWASSSNRIYVEGGGSATLSDIKNALPNAPLDLVDAANHVWLLRANLFVTDNCTLSLHGASAGGDVNELRLLSNNSSATNTVVNVDADAGTLDLNATRVTSWDQAVHGPDTEYAVYQRAFIRARSRQVGTTNQQSTLNVVNSDIGYLGFEDSEGYGLTWQVVSSVAGVRVFGNVNGSHIHHCQLGVSAWSADDVSWTGNEIAFNTLYGFDPNDAGHQAVLANNNVHDNTFGATFRFSSTSNRIYVEGGGSATLTDIKNALPNAPLDLVDAANRVWLLRANLFITDGSTLILHGSAAGGDVNEFRLLSNNSSSNSFVNVTADHGGIDIKNVRILSWDSAVNGPDTEYQTMGRAFIRVRAKLATDGVTPLESRMDIRDSDISYLGYDASESYGLSWKVIGAHPDPSKSIFDVVNVYGDIIGNRIHDSFWGVYSYGLQGGQWLNNEIDHNAGYGFDPHDDSDHLLIEGNNVHHNGGVARGTHGIIASRRCDHLVIRNNRSWANAENGIMLHRHSDDAIVENNITYLNGDSGIALFDVDRTTVRNNTILSNANAGIRITIGCADNVIVNNEIGFSGTNGFMIIPGNDPPEPDPVDPTATNRNRRNNVSSNYVHDCGAEGLKHTDGDLNVFIGNVFARNLPKISFTTSTDTQFISNSLPADVTVRLTGSASVTNTLLFEQQPLVNLSLADAFSAATFQDASGAIFDFDPDNVATRVGTRGSSVTVTSAEIGTGVTALTRNLFVRVPGGQLQNIPPGSIMVNPTLWETAGDLRKEWTVQSPDSAASLGYTVGDLAPNATYSVLKNGQPLSSVQSDSTGRITLSDAPGTTATVQYAVAPGGPPPQLPTVNVTANDAAAGETGADPGSFTVTRTGDTAAALTVNYSVGGTAANGSDYSTLSGSATIPAGGSSANITVSPIDDTAVEGNETVVLTISPDPAYATGSASSATVTIADNDQSPTLPTVAVVDSDGNAAESGANSGSFTVSRTGSTAAALTVRYSLGGTAANGSDYSTLPGSVTIPAGSASATIMVNTIDDSAVEGDENVVLTLSADAAYVIGSPSGATVDIEDNDQAPTLPTVTVTAGDANASESGPNAGTFTVSRSGDTTSSLTVKYSVGGTAANGSDYSTLSGSATIAAGSSSANVTVNPTDDSTVEGNETVVLTLAADVAYTVGSPSSATVTLADNDQEPTLPTVTVTASDANAAESGPDAGTFTVSRSGDTTSSLTVKYSVDGTAANGSDYSTLSGSVTIAAGGSSASVTVSPIDDTAVESSETVVLTLASDAAYTVGSPGSATVTIADNDQSPTLPTVTVVDSDGNAAESGANSGSFTVSRTGSTAAALTVRYSLGGSAANGADYSTLPGSVSIPAGSASATVVVNTIDDSAVEGDENVVLTLAADSAYTVGSPSSATVDIEDNDQTPTLPTVTVTASDANASEQGPDAGRFIVSRSGATTAALTVKYSLGGSAANGSDYSSLSGSVTIPTGSSSAYVTVNPVNDSAVEGTETVVLTLTADAAYAVGSPGSATVTIADNDQASPSTISVVATAAITLENGFNPAIFTISRTGDATVALTVRYSVSGTAANGTDYHQLSGSVTIPPGATSVNVEVRPMDDLEIEVGEVVFLTLTPDPSYNILLNLAFVTIVDNDLLGGGGVVLPGAVVIKFSLSGAIEGKPANGTINLSWEATAGQRYQLQYTSDLKTTYWINLGDIITATNGTVVVSDVISAGSQRFYRAIALP